MRVSVCCIRTQDQVASELRVPTAFIFFFALNLFQNFLFRTDIYIRIRGICV